ncbi:hypothetical protein H7F50_13930 [Novosphingobium flavum]|uniref:hypothetical protein n=1 Tax=Novosphingobium aerophilum TaxID=2839843 RepID=UPI00163B2176|nr:hypothetical protein [Novosphingobium aerophilum]MBC2662853.1 hypothetical protein [Novosphingobium aerophilum]
MSLVLALILAAGATAAEPADPGKAATPEPKADPIVCETIGELGSRIRGHKVCMHRSEWDSQRQSNKTLIERTQVQRTLEAGH